MQPARSTLRVALQRLNHDVIGGLYAAVFARPSTQTLNNALFYLALRGQGYNSGSQIDRSGERRFIRRLARFDPVVCVDVGANRGHYSEALLQETSSHVIAFEPLPKAFAAVVELSRRYPGRLTVVNAGVGDAEAVLDLHFGTDDSEHASFSTEVSQIGYVGANNVNVLPMQVITLDSYFADADAIDVPQIDLIKIDTEGFEHEVLVGATDTIARYRPMFVQIEYNLHQLFRAHSLYGLSLLLPGYRPFRVLPRGSGLHEVDPKQPQSNTYCYSNFVFVRSDLAGHM